MSAETVCSLFDSVKSNFNNAKQAWEKLTKDNYDLLDSNPDFNNVVYHVECMLSEAENMRNGAESMEKRLEKYRSAIEDLGFKRVKK